MISQTAGIGILLFFLIFGFYLQYFGVIDGPFNNYLQMGSIDFELMGYQIVSIPVAPLLVLRDFFSILAIILSIYYGGNKIIGLVFRTNVNTGTDFGILFKIAVLSFLFSVVSPIFSLFSFLYSLGELGKILMLFLSLLYFVAVYSYISQYSL